MSRRQKVLIIWWTCKEWLGWGGHGCRLEQIFLGHGELLLSRNRVTFAILGVKENFVGRPIGKLWPRNIAEWNFFIEIRIKVHLKGPDEDIEACFLVLAKFFMRHPKSWDTEKLYLLRNLIFLPINVRKSCNLYAWMTYRQQPPSIRMEFKLKG